MGVVTGLKADRAQEPAGMPCRGENRLFWESNLILMPSHHELGYEISDVMTAEV
jgi:hypothetical protein